MNDIFPYDEKDIRNCCLSVVMLLLVVGFLAGVAVMSYLR